ncbi:MAG: hypothetical protein PHS31_03650 [Victivallaceae bacterium]|nr:hypothetical protein [Victivallaceae bacterium]
MDKYGKQYLSKLKLKTQDKNSDALKTIWLHSWKNPVFSGTGDGTFQFWITESRDSRYFYLFLGILRFPTASQILITEIDTEKNFELTRSEFLINTQSRMSIVANVPDRNIIMKGGDRDEFFVYNRFTHTLSPLLTQWQRVYHSLPFELAILSKKPKVKNNFRKILLKIGEMEIADPIGYFDALANDSYFVSNSNFCLSESYKHYLAIMGILEYQYLSDRINALPADKAKEKIKISIADLNFIEEAKIILRDFEDNIELNQQKLAFSLYYEDSKSNTSFGSIGDNEARRFYDNYKWAFRRNFTAKSDYYSFADVESFIYAEIRRLKSYGLEEFVNTPPKVEIIWKKEEAPSSKRGWFDPLPPEEMERRKREFLASQPLKELFSASELEELFTEPDYAKITDPLELARVYDWFGKYPEALRALEKADRAEAKFELGRFLKHGRPGVPANKKKANELFSEIVSSIDTKGSSSLPEDYCLAGRASSEYIPKNWDETVSWRKRAAGFYKKSIAQGYRSAYYYSQYYLRHSSDNNPQELLKTLPTDNLEINAFIAAMAAINPRFKAYRDRNKNLAAIKNAIQSYNNEAQYLLGLLYLVSDTDPNAFLRHNRQKAIFWLQRAAERGNTDATQVLQNDSRLRRLKK